MLILVAKAEEGIARVRRAVELIGGGPLARGALCLAYGLLGCRDKASQALGELEAMGDAVPPLALAWAYLGVGDDRVFECLGKAIDARHPAVTVISWQPMFDGIRSDPRFRALLARVGLD
jgi:hypothetical protein